MASIAQRQLVQVRRGLRKLPTGLQGDRRAVVACLLRESPDELEVLFILRASNKGDRWSGQVGFPGGHVEIGETDQEAAVRECQEELGIDITPCTLLGEVKQRSVSTTRDGVSSTLIVACQVYLALGPLPTFELETAEIAASGWVPLAALECDDYIQPLNWTELTGGEEHWNGFPAVALPVDEKNMVVGGGLAKSDALPLFQLWGLTLGIVNDFLLTCGLRKNEIDSISFNSSRL
jgi:8-oxo-dGTP pyrophosphatase MutT (NUDIX family)